MGFMSKVMLESVAKGEIQTPTLQSIEFTAKHISEALNRQIGGTFTGKQVVKITS
jgi:hypothetical protein